MANVWKSLAGQKIAVRAWNVSTGLAKTGDAANITAQISKDGGVAVAMSDVNPSEIDAVDHPGLYIFDLSLAESGADLISITPVSATSNIVLDPIDFHLLPQELKLMYEDAITFGNATGTPTTTVIPSDVGEVTVDHFKNMYLVFVTGPMKGAGGKISAYSATGEFTLATAMVAAPASGNGFMVLGHSE